MKLLSQSVLDRAIIERRRQLEDAVHPDNLLVMRVSRDEMDAWVSDFHAPFACGVPLRVA